MPINWYQPRQILGPSASLYEKKLAKIHLRIEKLALKGKNNFLEYNNLVNELVEKGDYSALEQCLFYYYGIDIINAASVESIKKSTWDEICFQTQNPFLIKLKRMYDQKSVYQVSYDIFSTDNSRIQISLSNPVSSTYSMTGLTSSFSLFRTGDVIYMNVLNTDLHSVNIERAIWATQSGVYQPIYTEDFQQFFIGTYSGYKNPSTPFAIDIPTTVMREYQISVEVKSSTASLPWYSLNHRVEISKDSYLGQIYEVDIFTPDAEYYVKNSQYAKIVGARKSYLEVYKVDTSTSTGLQINPNIYAYDNLAFTEDQNLLTRYTQAIDYLNS